MAKMAKKKQSESVATKMTMVLRPRKLNIGVEKVKENGKGKMPMKVKITGASRKIKVGNAVERKFEPDEGNTTVVGNEVKKLKVVMKKNEMINKDAASASTRVLRSKRADNEDEFGKKDYKKKSSEAKTKEVKKNLLAKKEAPLTIRSPGLKKKSSGKKVGSHTIGNPKPRKNLPAKASKRTTRKSGKFKDPLSKEQARKKTNTISLFPPEIIMEILSWLPVKLFGTPMVVCKQWYALIQDRHFIEKHMLRNSSYIDSEVRQGYSEVYAYHGLKLEMNTSTRKYCIRNPDTKQFLELPDPQSSDHFMCFTYVPLIRNYKIVSVYYNGNIIECCDLSVGKDELSWRPLKMPIEDYSEYPERDTKKFSVAITGDVVHCVRVAASVDGMVEIVVSLDLGTEQFTVTNLPKGQYKNWEKVWPICYNGKLALMDVVGAELCVVVLENYKKQKWGKKESLFPSELMKKLEIEHGTIFPDCVQSETLWFWEQDTNKSVSYNIKTKCISLKNWYGHSLVRLKGMQPE